MALVRDRIRTLVGSPGLELESVPGGPDLPSALRKALITVYPMRAIAATPPVSSLATIDPWLKSIAKDMRAKIFILVRRHNGRMIEISFGEGSSVLVVAVEEEAGGSFSILKPPTSAFILFNQYSSTT